MCICCKTGDSDTFKIGYTNDLSRRMLELDEQHYLHERPRLIKVKYTDRMNMLEAELQAKYFEKKVAASCYDGKEYCDKFRRDM